MTDISQIIESRSAMLLFTYDQKRNAASIFANFLQAIFSSLRFGCPEYVDITCTDSWFTIVAAGGSLDTDHESFQGILQLFDIRSFQPSIFSSITPELGRLLPIVWFTEYCVVNVTTSKGVFKRGFLNGYSVTEVSYSHSDNKDPLSLSFTFTIGAPFFEETKLDSVTLRNVISIWRKSGFAKYISKDNIIPRIKLKWLEQSQYTYSLRIKVFQQTE